MLNPVFKVRFFDFQLDAPIAVSRAPPPFVLRVRVDDRAINTKGFPSSNMRPTWDDDVYIEYVAPSIEQLTSRYLVIECYGGNDTFLGSSRLSLYDVASGPSNFHLDLKQGLRDVGKLDFRCTFELLADVSINFSRIRIDSLPALGYDGNPNPYLTLHVGAGDVKESSIAAGSRAPEWSALPPVHFRGTYAQLCQQRVSIALKHCRNGFNESPADPTMAHVVLPLDRFAIEPRMCTIPFREMVHNDPGFPFPFSADMSGVIEFRNVHPIMQMSAGIRHDTGVVGGVPAVGHAGVTGQIRSSSPSRASHYQAQPLPTMQRATSPPRNRGQPPSPYVATAVAPPQQSFAQPSQYSSYVPPSQVHAQQSSMSMNYSAVPLPAVAPADLEMLDDVTLKQSSLLSKIEGRLHEIARRKADVAAQLSAAKLAEEMELEAASQRKVQLDGDLRNALLEKDRLEEHLRSIQLRREEESRSAVQQAAERERAKRALEEEQQEALAMQQRVVQLRNEMTRHLEEEEHRYHQRVREAEEARRRTQDDANALADLEARLAEAELRATVRQREEQHRSARRSYLGSPNRSRR
jgi:hypothetical protein